MHYEAYITPSGEEAYRRVGPFPPPGPPPGPVIRVHPEYRAAAEHDDTIMGFVKAMDRMAARDEMVAKEWEEMEARSEMEVKDQTAAGDM